MSGHTAEFGFITLDQCCRTTVKVHEPVGSDRAICRGTFQPTRVWLGDRFERSIVAMNLSDTRLGGYFRTPGLEVVRRYSPDHETLFEALGNPAEIWSVHPHRGDHIPLGSTPFSLRLSSALTSATSHVSGHTVSGTTMLD
jgi:hypothetical protein